MGEIRHWWPGLEGASYAWSVVAGSLALACAIHWVVGRLRGRTHIRSGRFPAGNQSETMTSSP